MSPCGRTWTARSNRLLVSDTSSVPVPDTRLFRTFSIRPAAVPPSKSLVGCCLSSHSTPLRLATTELCNERSAKPCLFSKKMDHTIHRISFEQHKPCHLLSSLLEINFSGARLSSTFGWMITDIHFSLIQQQASRFLLAALS